MVPIARTLQKNGKFLTFEVFDFDYEKMPLFFLCPHIYKKYTEKSTPNFTNLSQFSSRKRLIDCTLYF